MAWWSEGWRRGDLRVPWFRVTRVQLAVDCVSVVVLCCVIGL